MIKREGKPICAKTTIVNIKWESPDPDTLNFVDAGLVFENVNMDVTGEIIKEKTSLQFDAENPIPWADDTPQAIKDAFPNGVQDALRYSLGVMYESDRHQWILGTIPTPVEPEEPFPPES